MPNQHVVPHNGRWAVKAAGSQKATSLHNTQSKAFAKARDTAINQNSEVVVHKSNGQIGRKHSYGNDPHPPRG